MKLKLFLFVFMSSITFSLNEIEIDKGIKILDKLTNGTYEQEITTIIDRRIDKELVPIRIGAISTENTINSIKNSLERVNEKNSVLKPKVKLEENNSQVKVIYYDDRTEILEFSNGQRIIVSK